MGKTEKLDFNLISDVCYQALLSEMRKQFPDAVYFDNWEITFTVE